ncbi:uncharacterized protein TNIN_379451 [Trichonephila inaurata madagascariensis]|uniref:Uncharacterized protein n=1 Tax=Trichonephila inaurata madagascariensis TaxID=2747483 RepID=A0A8X6XSY7_9ARAC|nr:uncharacterized protein TNIN_379451 [Trichonephila inaurata madagascariensis]
MFMSLLSLHITGIMEIGLDDIYKRTSAGGRLHILDFSPDLAKTYTIWNSVVKGMALAFGFYGTNQIQVQRFLSMGGCKKAQS